MKKTVLITGASHGIGKSCAILFAQHNYNVIINYNRSELEAKLLASELVDSGFNAIAIRANVANRFEVDEMIQISNKVFGSIHVLVNNAGIAHQKLFTDVSEYEWDEIFNTNVKGTFNCSQAVLKDMIKNHHGKIINVSSILGMVGASCEVAYSASKAAIIGFSKALAKEVGPSNITVNVVAPGIIDTKMNSNISSDVMEQLKYQTPLCRIGNPDEVANAILFLASQKANFITGQVISPNGGLVV